MRQDDQIYRWAHMLDEAMEEKLPDKAIIVVDVDVQLDDSMLLRSDGGRDSANGEHLAGQLFMKRLYVVDDATARKLIGMNTFYANFTPTRCIIDELADFESVDGYSSGVSRMASPDLQYGTCNMIRKALEAEPNARVYRFVAPQAFVHTKRLVTDRLGRVVDLSTMAVHYVDNKPAELVDARTDQPVAEFGIDVFETIPTQIFGYWQSVDVSNMSTTQLTDKRFEKASFAPGQRFRIDRDKINTMIEFVLDRKRFMPGADAPADNAVVARPKYRTVEQFEVTNTMFNPNGIKVGVFGSVEDAVAAARQNFAEWTANGWVRPDPEDEDSRVPSPEELVVNGMNVVTPKHAYFEYAARRGYKTSKKFDPMIGGDVVYRITRRTRQVRDDVSE